MNLKMEYNMSDELFDKQVIDEIIKKIKKDKSGNLSRLMQKVMEISEEAGKKGFTLRELSIMGTTGWYLSQNPELRQFFDQLLAMPPPKEDDVWN